MKAALDQIQEWFESNNKKSAEDFGRFMETLVLPCIQREKNDAPAHVLRDYTLVMEDNFDQGFIDPSKWQTSYLWGPGLTINSEEQYYVDTLNGDTTAPDPFVFNAQGNLEIVASPIQGTKPVTTNGLPGGQNYSSGVLIGRDNLCFTEGYAEVCCKVPVSTTDGAWVATWLLNCMYYNNAFDKNAAENAGVGNDKFNPEIDFMEMVYGPGYQGSNCVKNAYHYFTGDRNDPNNYKRWTLDGNNFIEVDYTTSQVLSQFNIYPDCDLQNKFQLPDICLVDYSQDFHTYAVDWCRDYIHYYVDGNIVNCINDPNLASDQSMYLLINFAVGGAFPFGNSGQLADVTRYPASFEIEYARIYTK